MKIALTICGCVALVAIAYAAYQIGFIAQELPDRVDMRLGTELEAMRRFASAELVPQIGRAEDLADMRAGQALKILDSQASKLRATSAAAISRAGVAAVQEVERTRISLREQLGSAVSTMDKQLDKTNASLAEAVTVIKPIRQAVEKVDATLPLYTDCDGGVCLFNDIHTTAVAIERTATAIEKQAPATTVAVREIAEVTAKRSHRSVWSWLFRRQQ